MRRLFSILLMVLLPLSSWAGDVMAINMIAAKLAAQVANTTDAHCPNMAAMHDTQSQDTQNSSACTDCQACHLFATQTQIPAINLVSHSPSVLQAEPGSFVSTQLSPPIKPPLS